MRDWKSIVRQRLEELNLRPQVEADLIEEMAQHLVDHERDLRSGGATEEEAFRETMAELDELHPLRQSLNRAQRMPRYDAVPAGDSKPGNPAEDVWRDVRYTLRSLRKSPVFVVFVVLALALGIGANTTVFTVINTLILNPLPVRDPDGLAVLARAEDEGPSPSGPLLTISYADLRDYQAGNTVFSSLSGYTAPRGLTWESSSGSEGMFSEFVTAGYFETLGVRPAKGRFFLREEDSRGAQAVAVMNYGTWQARFGGTDAIIGETLRLNGVVVTVVGVAPPGFIGVNAIFGPDLWMPASMMERLLPNQMRDGLSDRSKAAFLGVARLNSGVSRAQASANLEALASRLAREYPVDEGYTITLGPIRDALFSSSFGRSAPVVFASAALLVVVGIVLLIACSNVANLLLARSAARQQEMAVRVAMGASRRRLVRQLLTESVVLGCMSGALGLLLNYARLQLLFGALPATANFPSPKIDATVFVFTLVLSLASGFTFGVIPALKGSRAGVVEALKEEARTAGRSRRKVTAGSALLVAQVAFSFLLLAMASLFLRSIQRAYDIDPGFQTAHLAVFTTNPGQAGYARPQTMSFYREVRERVAALPGVESASWASNMPLWARPVTGLQVEGREQRSRAEKLSAIVNTVDRDYFETAGVAILSGRGFTDRDTENSMPVAVINEKMAHDYWPGGDAVGRRIRLPGERQMRQIVGIARTANYSAWGEPPQACLYAPLAQNYSDAMILYVRSRGAPEQVVAPVRQQIGAVAPRVLIGGALAGREIIDRGLFQARMGVALLSVFGLLALGLASIGLYGILAYSVNQRKREIGLRMALGAAQGAVLRLVLKQSMMLVLAGVLIGLAAAQAAGRLLSRMLFGLSASDPFSMAAAALVLLGAAMLASYLPARWASRVDPVVALREG